MTVIGGKVRISSGLREIPRLEAEYMSVLPPLYHNDEREKKVYQGCEGARTESCLDTVGASIYVLFTFHLFS